MARRRTDGGDNFPRTSHFLIQIVQGGHDRIREKDLLREEPRILRRRDFNGRKQ